MLFVQCVLLNSFFPQYLPKLASGVTGYHFVPSLLNLIPNFHSICGDKTELYSRELEMIQWQWHWIVRWCLSPPGLPNMYTLFGPIHRCNLSISMCHYLNALCDNVRCSAERQGFLPVWLSSPPDQVSYLLYQVDLIDLSEKFSYIPKSYHHIPHPLLSQLHTTLSFAQLDHFVIGWSELIPLDMSMP